MRALAAITVVLSHWSPLPLVPSAWSFYTPLRGLTQLSGANLGVVFFFTLSPFLLTYLAVREFEAKRAFHIQAFYLRRCFRIWPLYFTVLAFDLATAASNTPGWGTPDWPWIRDHAWLWVTFLSNWSIALSGYGGVMDPSTAPFRVLWSIAVEEQFYLVYPVVVSLALRSRRAFILAAILAWLTAILSRTYFLSVPVAPAGGMYYATTSYLDVFLIGCLAGTAAARKMDSRQFWVRALRLKGTGIILFILTFVLGMKWQNELYYPYTSFSVWIYGLTGALFALEILWVLTHKDSLISEFLRSRSMVFLGALSFGMYLWHPLVLPIAERLVEGMPSRTQFEIDARTSSQLAVYILIVVVVAWISHLSIEKPFLLLKLRYARRSAALKGSPDAPPSDLSQPLPRASQRDIQQTSP
ncbi:MAG: acyltransferase [Chloroflexi bacterium]|nr:acyltransferase [Chloroflexota bacterium]